MVALAVVGPWTIRNAITQDAFIPVASVGWGTTLFMGTIDVPYGSAHPWPTFEKDAEFARIRQTASSVQEAEGQMAKLAGERIGQAPLQWLWLRIKQYPRFWTGSGMYLSVNPAFKYVYIGASLAFWLIAIVGMGLAWRRWQQLYPLALVPIVLALIHFIGSAEERYSLPLVPMGAIFAGHAIAVFLRQVRKRTPPLLPRSHPH